MLVSCLGIQMLRGSEWKTSPATSIVSLSAPPGRADGSSYDKFTSLEQVRSKAVCLCLHGHIQKDEGRLTVNSNLESLGYTVWGC